jgi:hypothetical protein
MAGKSIKRTSDLATHQQNANRGTERGTQLLERSLRNLGFGRSILVDKNGRVIAGNHTTEKAVELGLEEVVVVRTKGDKVIVHQREDLDLSDKRAVELALLDNRVAEVNLDWDAEILQALKENGEVDLRELGFSDAEIEKLIATLEAPEDFATHDENIPVQHVCPKCGHKWSGRADAGKKSAKTPKTSGSKKKGKR